MRQQRIQRQTSRRRRERPTCEPAASRRTRPSPVEGTEAVLARIDQLLLTSAPPR